MNHKQATDTLQAHLDWVNGDEEAFKKYNEKSFNEALKYLLTVLNKPIPKKGDEVEITLESNHSSHLFEVGEIVYVIDVFSEYIHASNGNDWYPVYHNEYSVYETKNTRDNK